MAPVQYLGPSYTKELCVIYLLFLFSTSGNPSHEAHLFYQFWNSAQLSTSLWGSKYSENIFSAVGSPRNFCSSKWSRITQNKELNRFTEAELEIKGTRRWWERSTWNAARGSEIVFVSKAFWLWEVKRQSDRWHKAFQTTMEGLIERQTWHVFDVYSGERLIISQVAFYSHIHSTPQHIYWL